VTSPSEELLLEAKKKQEEARKLGEEASRLERLTILFPDLTKHVGRWNKVVYKSKLVNENANGVETRHNCGCCRDSPLEAWVFLETPAGRVYSDPPMFVIGESNPYGSGDDLDLGWDGKLRDAKIPESVISTLKSRYEKPEENEDGTEE
jgi:hypothetical protein